MILFNNYFDIPKRIRVFFFPSLQTKGVQWSFTPHALTNITEGLHSDAYQSGLAFANKLNTPNEIGSRRTHILSIKKVRIALYFSKPPPHTPMLCYDDQHFSSIIKDQYTLTHLIMVCFLSLYLFSFSALVQQTTSISKLWFNLVYAWSIMKITSRLLWWRDRGI